MKSICGYWALDAAPTAPTTVASMRSAAVHAQMPRLEHWQQDSMAFGAAWWSPQANLHAPQCLVQHLPTGCTVVADARLDNPGELREALQLPAPDGAPDSATDHAAQLILHAWLRWGEDCVDYLDGDFAFAVHDPRREALYLARDRMAGRPLYVHHQPGRLLVFGSSVHAVLAHPRVPRDRNEARIADFLIEGLEGVDVTSTFHLAVERHPSAHCLLVTPQHQRLRRYWQLHPGRAGPLPRGDDEWAAALTEALERAVAQRRAGPTRVGAMLSGGLDSTAIAIIAGEQLRIAGREPLHTFSSIDSGLPDCKETAAVRLLARCPCFVPTLIDHADLGDRFPALDRFLDEFDEPFDASMSLPDAQYQAAAGATVDAVMDGIDGDTLFTAGGTLRRQLRTAHWAGAVRNARGLARIYGGTPSQHLVPAVRSAALPAWARRWLWPLRNRQRQQQFLDGSLISPDFAERVDVEARLQSLRAQRSLAPWSRPGMEAVESLQHPYPVVALERYGRVAARHGITPLHPFTERRLLELCIHLPDRQRLRDGWSKAVLRHAMRERMPAAVQWRSDKQHLGRRLTHALWEQRRERLLAQLHGDRHLLAPYLDLAKLDGAVKQYCLNADQQALAQLLQAVRLAKLLSRA